MSLFYIPNNGNSLPHMILDKLGIRGSHQYELSPNVRDGKAPGTARSTMINFKVWTSSRAELSHSRLYTMNLADPNGRQKCIAAIMKITESDCEPKIISSFQTHSLLNILGKCKNIWSVRQQAVLQLIHNPKLSISYGFVNFNGNERGLVIFYSQSPLYVQNGEIEHDLMEEDDKIDERNEQDIALENFITEASKSAASDSILTNVNNQEEEKIFHRYRDLDGDKLRDLLMALKNAL